MMLARDVSNYSDPITAELLAQWRAEGVGLILIQAFPPSYHQYEQQRDQMRVCAAEGMPFDCYVYDYLGAPDWLAGALDGLDQVLLPSEKPRKVWLDEEDTETEAGWTQLLRAQTIEEHIGAVQQHGYPVGIYTGAWWWVGRVAPSAVAIALPLWAAQYDGIPDTSVFTAFSGWQICAIKQYAGSQPDGTDLNVLSAQEEQDLLNPDFPDIPPNTIPPDSACDSYTAAITRAVNRLQIELDRKTAAGKSATLRRTLIKEIAGELFGALG